MTRTIAALLLLASTASAQVVVDTNIRASADLYSHTVDELPLWFWVMQQEPQSIFCLQDGCETFVGFDYHDGVLSGETLLLDEGSDWFVVQPGDVFSAATAPTLPILLGTANRMPPLQYNSAEVGTDFFLGVRTGFGPNRNAYGWVHMSAEGGQLSMLANVMAYNTTGIVVGTTAVVPEPATLAQWAAWLLLIQFARKPLMHSRHVERHIERPRVPLV